MEPIRRSAVRLIGAETFGADDQIVAAKRRGLTDEEARTLLVDEDADPAEVGKAFAKLQEQTKETL